MNQDYKDRAEISVAPMMDWTDSHCRYFHRLISPHVKLYTEMVTTGALLHGDKERFLRFDTSEHPVALQLGGSNAEDLAQCAEMGAKHGYDEINLNCGCPSDRVQKGRFGACLMKEPEHVAACIEAMIKASTAPVTVKCRIGVDDQDSLSFLSTFVEHIANKGCKTFVIHARKAWLKGLSPKQNREIPPLDYERVAAVKNTYPELRIILNGGITDIKPLQEQLKIFDGIMIGREAYQNPYFLAKIENHVFQNTALQDRDSIANTMAEYAKQQFELYQTPVKSITRHILGLYHQQPGAKAWKQTLSTLPYSEDADFSVILSALEAKNKAAAKQKAA